MARWACTVTFVGLAAWWTVSGWYQVSCWTSGTYIQSTVGVIDWASGLVGAEPPGNGLAMVPLANNSVLAHWEWGFHRGPLRSMVLTIGPGRSVELVEPWVTEVPIWPALAVLGPLSCRCWWVELRSRATNRRAMCCRTCNYDRRGLPADAKCPECGARPSGG